MKRLLFAALLLAVSCSTPSSPEEDGKLVAEEENRCAEKFVNSVWKRELSLFDQYGNDTYRLMHPTKIIDVVKSYRDDLRGLDARYTRDLEAAAALKREYVDKYSGNAEKLREFEAAYAEKKDSDLPEMVERLRSTASVSVPFVVYAFMNDMSLEKPDARPIQFEMLGRCLDPDRFAEDIHFYEERLKELKADDSAFPDEIHMVSETLRMFRVLLGK